MTQTISIQPEWLSGFLGVAVPVIVRLISGMNASRRFKSIVAIIVSTILGFVSSFLAGQFSFGVILQSSAIAFSTSQVLYDQFFKDALR